MEQKKLQNSSFQQKRLLCINFILQRLCGDGGQVNFILHEETGEQIMFFCSSGSKWENMPLKNITFGINSNIHEIRNHLATTDFSKLEDVVFECTDHVVYGSI